MALQRSRSIAGMNDQQLVELASEVVQDTLNGNMPTSFCMATLVAIATEAGRRATITEPPEQIERALKEAN